MRGARDLARAVMASVAVVASAIRLAILYPRLDLDNLVSHLRSSAARASSKGDLCMHANVVRRLGRLLPPWGMGACLKRSLILLDLAHRRGASPRLHLCVANSGEGATAHAWVSGAPGVPDEETCEGAVFDL